MEKKERKFKTSELLTVVVFMTVLGALSLLLLVLPKHTGELSSLEFRSLADDPFKGKSANTLMSELVTGDMSKNVDKFLEDHYPARNFFIALNSYYLRLTGRNANQGVVWGRNDRLFEAPIEKNEQLIEKNMNRINEFTEANGLDTVVVISPSSAVVNTEDLPLVHLEYSDTDIIDSARSKTSAYVPDLAGLFSARGDRSGLFYRTDHHWTMDGAYLCYCDVLAHYGDTPADKSAFTVSSYEFYGSYYRKAGLWLTEPDSLEVWRSPVLDAMDVTIGWGDRAVTYKGVYDEEQLKEGNVDKYAAYLWSNNDLTVIENPQGNGETIMIVKDSFGNSIIPLFAMTYSRVVMVDTRYYKSPSLPMPSELVSEYGITKLVIVFGEDDIIADVWISYLR